ncbi:MAG: histidine phosphatase family protein [Candidatus Eremiobacteraeota bacterium]|nr:histidine phosphatase family protein [Candidatus Eremiobacteraeota bacterium]
MRCFFLRHGQAFDPSEWRGSDFDRPLTPGGCERMAREAKTIARLGVDPDAIVCSPLARARQTACIVAKGLHRSKNIIEDPRLGAAFDAEAFRAVLNEHADAKSLMFVGHEPGMGQTVQSLTGARVEFKKGALACVEVSADARAGTLLFLLPPKALALKTN